LEAAFRFSFQSPDSVLEMGLRKDKGDSGTVAQEIQPAGEVSPCLFANVDFLPPPPVSSTGQALTPPTKGGEFLRIPFIPELQGRGFFGRFLVHAWKRRGKTIRAGIQKGTVVYCTKKLSQNIKVRQEARVFIVTAALASSVDPCISLAIT